jgi:putative FmdB family regulatory protein
MPIYEYYCRTCKAKFSQLRPLSAAGVGTTCAAGHPALVVLSVPARAMVQSAGGARAEAAPAGGGGACGGAGCGCRSLN